MSDEWREVALNIDDYHDIFKSGIQIKDRIKNPFRNVFVRPVIADLIAAYKQGSFTGISLLELLQNTTDHSDRK